MAEHETNLAGGGDTIFSSGVSACESTSSPFDNCAIADRPSCFSFNMLSCCMASFKTSEFSVDAWEDFGRDLKRTSELGGELLTVCPQHHFVSAQTK
jgi:hypothetical protein